MAARERCRAPLVVALLTLLTPCLFAQTVSNPSWGYWFESPSGWVVQNCDQDGAMLGHKTVPGIVLVLPHTLSSLEKVRTEMKPALVTEGVNLHLKGELKALGDEVLVGDYEGEFQGQPAKARIVGGFSKAVKKGCYIMGVALPNEYSRDLAKAVEAVTKSLRFGTPAAK